MLAIAIIALILSILALCLGGLAIVGSIEMQKESDEHVNTMQEYVNSAISSGAVNNYGLSSGATSEAIRRIENRLLKLEETPPLTRALTHTGPVHSRDRLTQVDE